MVVSGTMNNPASVIGTIADLSEILADVDVDETEIVDVARGQEATVDVDAHARQDLPRQGGGGRQLRLQQGPTSPTSPSSRSRCCSTTPTPSCAPACRCARRSRTAAARRARSRCRSRRWSSASPEAREEGAGRRRSRAEPEKVVFVVGGGQGRAARPVETGISDDDLGRDRSPASPAASRSITGPYRSLRDLEDGEAVDVTTPEKSESGQERQGRQGRRRADTKSSLIELHDVTQGL